MADVMVDGVWAHSFGQVSDVSWSDSWGDGACGPSAASFTIDLDPSNDSSWLRIGRKVEVWEAGRKQFGGRLTEMGRGVPREIHAAGWATRAADFDALDSAGNPTTNPQVAVTEAIARGLEWAGDLTLFDNTSFGDDSTAGTNRLDALLNAWAAANGKRWGVDAEGYVFVTTDPTAPTWWLDASDLDIGVAEDGLFTRVNARYVSSVTGTPPEPSGWSTATVDDAVGQALYDVIEYPMDLTPLGLLNSTQAGAYAQQQLDLLTVPQWLQRVTTNPTRLLSAGGLPAHLPSVKSGQMVQLFNVPNNLGGLRSEMSLRVVLGETQHDDSAPSQITIAPVGLAVRNLADALAQAARAASDARAAATGGGLAFTVTERGGRL